MLIARGASMRALADYSEAIRINPEYAQAYTDRGVIHYIIPL